MTESQHEAHAKVDKDEQRGRITALLMRVATQGYGLACFEVERVTSIDRKSVGARMSEMRADGEIRDSGGKRFCAATNSNQAVWVLGEEFAVVYEKRVRSLHKCAKRVDHVVLTRAEHTELVEELEHLRQLREF
jgi:hypothetical protein